MQGQTLSDIKQYKGLTFKKLYSEQQCTNIIKELAQQINTFYQELKKQKPENEEFQITAICLLKGAFMFYTDLCKKLNMKIICQFVKITSYSGQTSTGEIKIEGEFKPEKYKGKHLLIIQDMADTGLTLQRFTNLIRKYEPQSVKLAVLVERPDKVKKYQIDWVGLHCSDFIIGYGLDFNQFGRNFPAIYQKI